jgi:hypothetical protein
MKIPGSNEKYPMKTPGSNEKYPMKIPASNEKLPMKCPGRPGTYMIYFSLNYVVLCTRPSRPRPQLYHMDGRYHSQNQLNKSLRVGVGSSSLAEHTISIEQSFACNGREFNSEN